VTFDKEFKSGTFEITEFNQFLILCQSLHRFTINPKSRIIQNNNIKHKRCTNISDFQNNHTKDSGNIWTSFQAHNNNLLKAHDKIMINKTTGNINNNQVIK
jgi:hypothetical protein